MSPTNTAPGESQGTPFVMTNAMKAKLRERGFTDEQIRNMTPQEAHEKLSDKPAVGKTNAKLEAALALVADGYAIFPLVPNAKHPLLKGKYVDVASRNEAQIRRWFTEHPDANIGRPTHGEVVVDVDAKHDGHATLAALKLVYDFPDTRIVETASGGMHIIFTQPPGMSIRNGTNIFKDTFGPGIDIRANGGLVVAPGSEVNGKLYKYLDERPAVQAPEWLLEFCNNRTRDKDVNAGKRVADQDEWTIQQIESFIDRQEPESVLHGVIDDTAYKVAARFADWGAEYETIVEYMVRWSEKCCVPPMELARIETISDSAGRNRDTAVGSKHWSYMSSGFEAVDVAEPSPDLKARIEAAVDWLEDDANEKAERLKEQQEAAGRVQTSLAYWLARDLPEPDYLMGAVFSTTSRAMLFAPTGLGKTQIGMALSMRMSAGVDFLGWSARRPCTVVYVDGEMATRLLKQRLADEVRRLGSMPEGFHALSHEDLGLAWQPLNTPEGQGVVEKVLSKIGNVDFLILDNIMSLIEGDPKDPEAWTKTLPWISRLTGRCIGQLWVHHSNEQGRMYGDKTRAWRMDTVAVMEKVENPRTDVSFRLTFDADKGGKARERTPQNYADFTTKIVTLIDDKWSYRVEQSKRPKVKSDSVAAQYLLALREALAHAAGCSVVEDAPPGTTVTKDAWTAVCVRRGLLDPDGKPDAFRADRSRYMRDLIAAGAIEVDGELVRLK